MLSLESLTGRLPEPLEWDGQLALGLRERLATSGVGFIAAWEIQSYFATMVLIALVGLLSPLIALAVMTGWSMLAAGAYYFARHRGLPNLLDDDTLYESSGAGSSAAFRRLFSLGVKAWLCGANALLFSRTLCRSLAHPTRNRRQKAYRMGVLALGLTLFGVSSTDHLLRKAGFSGRRLLHLSLLGPFLNVPYRVLLSAIVVNALIAITQLMGSGLAVISPV